MADRMKTPQADTTKAEALKLGADLVQARIEETRARSLRDSNAEGIFLDGVHYGVALGRLRAMHEQAKVEEDRVRNV